MSDLLRALGLEPRGANYETVKKRIRELGIDCSHLRAAGEYGRPLSTCSDQEIIEVVKVSRSLAAVLRQLGLRPGGNQSRLKRRIEALGLDTSHFLGQGWQKGRRTPVVPPRPLEEVLVEGSWAQSSHLRMRLIRSGLKEPKCEACGRDTWNDVPIPLELDHRNGRRDDNRLTNLRLLCPNCHAQTPTYRGRNIGQVS